MIDRNSRPAIMAVSRRDPRATLPPPWGPSHPLGIQTWRAVVTHGSGTQQSRSRPASDSQHVPHNGTLHGTRKSNAVPAGYRGAHPTQGQGWDGGQPWHQARQPQCASWHLVAATLRFAVASCPVTAAFLLWGQRNLGLTKERAQGGSGGRLWGSADQ